MMSMMMMMAMMATLVQVGWWLLLAGVGDLGHWCLVGEQEWMSRSIVGYRSSSCHDRAHLQCL
jgi:hypothetical protein